MAEQNERKCPGQFTFKGRCCLLETLFLNTFTCVKCPRGKLEMGEINKKVTWLRNKNNPNVDVNENQTS